MFYFWLYGSKFENPFFQLLVMSSLISVPDGTFYTTYNTTRIPCNGLHASWLYNDSQMLFRGPSQAKTLTSRYPKKEVFNRPARLFEESIRAFFFAI